MRSSRDCGCVCKNFPIMFLIKETASQERGNFYLRKGVCNAYLLRITNMQIEMGVSVVARSIAHFGFCSLTSSATREYWIIFIEDQAFLRSALRPPLMPIIKLLHFRMQSSRYSVAYWREREDGCEIRPARLRPRNSFCGKTIFV
jgi:hypothetical protein